MARFAILVVVLSGGPLPADEDRFGRWPVPAGARVTVEADKPTVFLGENVVLHLVVRNAGADPFRVFTGCDGRNPYRALRFKVTATDAAGREAADPHPSVYDGGGPGQEFEVGPGQKHFEVVPLHRYRRLDKPGTYTVRVWHDLGWVEAEGRKTPAAEVKLTVRLPDAAEARRVVAEMDGLKDPGPVRPGEKRPPYPDYSAFQHPVYLPIFAPRAREGDLRAVQALASIPDPGATAALIGLLDHKDAKVARAAQEAVRDRLPHPDLDKHPADQERAWLVKQAWKPDLAPAVRRAAGALAGGSAADRKAGAYLLECVGEAADLPAVIRGLDAAAAAAKAPDFDDAGVFQLREAGVALARRGAKLALPGKSAGERLLFAHAIAELPTYRPGGWEAAFAGLLRDDRACVRKAALDAFPGDPAPALVAGLADCLRDPDAAVRTAACWASLKAKSKDLERPLLGVLGSATDDRLLYAAQRVVIDHGMAPRVEGLRVLVGRLGEPGMARPCLKYLACWVVEGRSALDRADDPKDPYRLSAEEVAACQGAWRRVLKDRQKELAAGKTYPFDAPGLPTPELFPRVTFWRDR